jgi:hypothetical protein
MARIAGAIAIALLCLLEPRQAGAKGRQAGPDPAVAGRWSAPFDIHGVGVHASLLHTGQVLLFVYPRAEHGTVAWLWDTRNGAFTDVPLGGKRNAFCGGHSILPDGSVWVTGGTKWGERVLFGARETDFFSAKSRLWKRGPPMTYARWYPSNVTLPDGDVLVVSGEDENGQLVGAVERYHAASGTLETLPASAAKLLPDYPRLHLLTDGRVLLSGERADTWTFDPRTLVWSPVGSFQYGDRYESACVLLPGLERVLCLGGTHGTITAGSDGLHHTDHPYGDDVPEIPPTETAEILDLGQPLPSWRYTQPMHRARMHANAVLLPDGTVLVVGGGRHGRYDEAIHTSELFDPETETWTELAAQRAPRMYHSTALLLPDGRVLSAGMDSGPLKTTAEIYSPPYLYRGARPAITKTTKQLAYGQAFEITTTAAASIRRVVLMRPGSVTHSVDFEQRYVALSFEAAAGTLTAQSPAGGTIAPPGWYMLFVVNDRGVPSRAAWVLLA